MIRALTVEDNPLTTDALAALMRARGWAVTVCRTGAQALERLAEGDYDVVILDHYLPGGMSGVDTLRRVRQAPQWAALPVVLCTAAPEVDELGRDLQDLRPAVLVQKPCDPAALLQLVENLAVAAKGG